MNLVDIIIPLGPGTCSDNDELRLFLRSLQKNGRGYDQVWIVSDCAPRWLVPGAGLYVLPHPDRFDSNKDANLFEKLLRGLDAAATDEVVWTCDDCAILQECDLAELPPVWNPRGPEEFAKPADGKEWGKWKKRMWHTLLELGMEDGNWDAHVPQRWDVEAAKAAIVATPFARPEGRCINTAVMGRMFGGKKPAWAVEQDAVKETVESKEEAQKMKLDKVFVAYNDDGFKAGLRERLFGLFPEKSRWEVSAC